MLHSMKIFVMLVLLVVSASLAAEGIYRWIDDDGTVHFGDRKGPGRSSYAPRGATVYSAPPEIEEEARKLSESSEQGDSYLLKIISPAEGEAVRSGSGRVSVRLSTGIDLKEGDTLRLSLDGQLLVKDIKANQMLLSDVKKGRHTIVVSVSNKKGEIVTSSPGTTFNLLDTRELGKKLKVEGKRGEAAKVSPHKGLPQKK